MQRLLEVKNLSVCYGSTTIVDRVSFTLDEGQWLMLTGPNGAGKSTIVNAITRGVPYTGNVICLGQDIAQWKSAALARTMGILAQNHSVGYSFRVEEVVRMGRYAYSQGLGLLSSDPDCEEQIDAALELTGLKPMRSKSVLQLSGGELQRVFLAQLFAQNPQILILDEPTNHLDLIYQKQIFLLIREWLRQEGRAVLSVVHDLSLAKAYGTDAILLKNGKVVSQGKTEDVFTTENLSLAYEMDVYAWMRQMLGQWGKEKKEAEVC